MGKSKEDIVNDALGEAMQFAKDVRYYLYEIEKQRPLTEKEKELWDRTHFVHVHTNDARMIIQEGNRCTNNAVKEELSLLSFKKYRAMQLKKNNGKNISNT